MDSMISSFGTLCDASSFLYPEETRNFCLTDITEFNHINPLVAWLEKADEMSQVNIYFNIKSYDIDLVRYLLQIIISARCLKQAHIYNTLFETSFLPFCCDNIIINQCATMICGFSFFAGYHKNQSGSVLSKSNEMELLHEMTNLYGNFFSPMEKTQMTIGEIYSLKTQQIIQRLTRWY